MRRVLRLTGSAWLAGPLIAAAQTASTPASTLDEPGRPLWEAGLAAGGGSVADYPGADQAHWRGIVLPVLIYRGPILRVDQEGVRGRFVSTPDWTVDLTATAAFNARSNDAREGMPDLDYLFGVGPQVVYKGWQSRDRGPTLHLKLRAVMSTDFKRIDQRGFTIDPELRWRVRGFSPRGALTLSIQPSWASGGLQRYFYEVPPSQATATRPAYAARAGYLGTDAKATWSVRSSPSITWFATGWVTSLHGAANASSPLLKKKTNFNIGAGIVWTPWRSERLAP
jgi:outer membrane scaffolding protein for murein synthesis (MipA/OmpV family)